MRDTAKSPAEYIEQLPEERKPVIRKLRTVIRKNIPKGFREEMSYGMIGWVVPHSRYPAGYHCDPQLPLPFMNIASQKNYVAVYHNGIYADEKLLKWFTGEYPKYSDRKPDMGKSCIRFRKMDAVPYDLIGKLASKVTVDQWISTYKNVLKR
jgi:uncharacterized protein YdhG (YjbR/CyaY superfamily)